MASGYDKGFIIEHDDTLRMHISCADCSFYESDDKSCMKRPLYLPEDGYNSWKHCKYFEMNRETYNYEEKRERYDEYHH